MRRGGRDDRADSEILIDGDEMSIFTTQKCYKGGIIIEHAVHMRVRPMETGNASARGCNSIIPTNNLIG
ncbi:hypothetical protein Lal_00045469 [Lupinus albus]|nr:hypothetical protein Lal_00045469 [Lupinus albus]